MREGTHWPGSALPLVQGFPLRRLRACVTYIYNKYVNILYTYTIYNIYI
jgi:hypothetical protein